MKIDRREFVLAFGAAAVAIAHGAMIADGLFDPSAWSDVEATLAADGSIVSLTVNGVDRTARAADYLRVGPNEVEFGPVVHWQSVLPRRVFWSARYRPDGSCDLRRFGFAYADGDVDGDFVTIETT